MKRFNIHKIVYHHCGCWWLAPDICNNSDDLYWKSSSVYNEDNIRYIYNLFVTLINKLTNKPWLVYIYLYTSTDHGYVYCQIEVRYQSPSL